MISRTVSGEVWPALPLHEWRHTCSTLHMWTQIVGKVRLELSPVTNHWWEVPFYLTARGLTTSPMPYGDGAFEVQFDFINHRLEVDTSWGESRGIHLGPRSVAWFYHEFMEMLRSLGIEVKIWPMPVEVPDPIRFDEDELNASYDAEYVHAFWRILLTVDTIFKEFRARFIGKDSPVHFFWGSFDLAVSRFSGKRAPERPGADSITREAYSHEVCSAGFWPGSGDIQNAAFYSYTFPEPLGYSGHAVRPPQTFYHEPLHEFVLMYDDVRISNSPRESLLEFLQTTYEAGAIHGEWDREALECNPEEVITPAYDPHKLSAGRRVKPQDMEKREAG